MGSKELNMKPSERINQIIDEVQSEYPSWNVLEAGLSAVARYLDEEWEKNNPHTHMFATDDSEVCLVCDGRISRY